MWRRGGGGGGPGYYDDGWGRLGVSVVLDELLPVAVEVHGQLPPVPHLPHRLTFRFVQLFPMFLTSSSSSLYFFSFSTLCVLNGTHEEEKRKGEKKGGKSWAASRFIDSWRRRMAWRWMATPPGLRKRTSRSVNG